MSHPFKNKIYTKVGHLLLEERFSRMLMLERVSKEAGMPMNDIRRVEMGKAPTWDSAVKLADYYGKVIKFTLTDGVPSEYLTKQEEEKADNS